MATPTPKISVIMVDGSFRERYESIDFLARQTLPAADYELLWCEYGATIQDDLARRLGQHPNFRAICLGRDDTYHAAACFNEGIRQARGELVVMPDADVIARPEFLETVWRSHGDSDRLVEYFYRYNEPQHLHRDEIELEHLAGVCINTNPSNHGGCSTVRRERLLEINGYDTHPIFAGGTHCNDLELYTRLKAQGLFVRWNPSPMIYHPWHPATGTWQANDGPMRNVIEWRAREVETRTFRGLDPSRDMVPPAALMRQIEWLQSTQLPFSQRAARKIRKTLRRVAA